MYRFHETDDILTASVPFSRGRYIQDISIVCTFGKAIEEIGEELAKKLLSVRDINPEVLIPTL